MFKKLKEAAKTLLTVGLKMNSVVVEVTTLIQKHHSNGFEVGRVVVTPELTTAHQQERQFLHQSTVKLSNHGNHRGVEVMKHKFMTVTNTHTYSCTNLEEV